MSALALDLEGAEVLLPGAGLVRTRLSLAEGVITSHSSGRAVDLSGYRIVPGIVDLHGDGFERHVASRRGAVKDAADGVIATEAELAVNGITTAVLAQFHSWEGGVRSPEFADRVMRAIARVRGDLATDLIPQLRFEIHLLGDYQRLPQLLQEWGVHYLVFNDHLPHARLADGRKPPRLAGQALRAGRNPERHLELMQRMHAQRSEVPAALDRLTKILAVQGVHMGSHDDTTAQGRNDWSARGVRISEFPETVEAATAAREGGDSIILGAPNVVRGGSHNSNVSAQDLIEHGLCDALASDYHYPSPRRAALLLVERGICDFETAWGLVSSGPAQVLGLQDRGALLPGMRADLAILDAATGRVAAVMAAGTFTYLSGAIGARFMAVGP
ncbi:alpha-D-ribose 1-methylphosphonate 5-triphosphate diphosphatase [Pontibaca salina]|uniref:Alpha-D-ribose 1-methylphosphonate 5-triphosphate diphosphatase n=1 Tax=Pontibaca salina TaxID=2795731 RepID=A0A934LZC1_9RHOB|nr:alpha-D-ribose 1-methylphosphonate 5-triphosphate diphosphatase [Pontibaca salina]MBI6628840.1 alpha-D-ribose 1-methylphosphonate 5-triphosphate diphosphatase [Pontibaca salina]